MGFGRSLIVFLLPVVFAVPASGQTVITTTAIYDGVAAPIVSGTLRIDAASSPTLFLINGATLTSGITSLTVGGTNSGGLTLSGGSTLTNSGDAYLGTNPAASGTANIVGTNTTWNMNAGILRVGNYGTGLLAIRDGGTVTTATGIVGANSSGFGSVVISGASSAWNASDQFRVGNFGQGQLLVEGGGTLTSATGVIAYNPDSTGTATIEGSGSHWDASNRLYVGLYGAATMNVLNGATVMSQTGIVASVADSVGIATISGANSQWTTGIYDMYVGNSGNGKLYVSDGGSVVAKSGIIGATGDGVGLAVVSGTNSQWHMTAELNVGERANGVLNILNGGTVISISGHVGYFDGSSGAVNVSGINSSWTVTNNLAVGGRWTSSGGTGSLSISSGGAVYVGGSTKVWQAGELNIGAGGTLQTDTIFGIAGSLVTIAHGAEYGGNLQSAGALVVDGTVNSDTFLQTGGTLQGSGTIAGVVFGAGLVAPGNSPGVLGITQVEPTSGMDFLFEFTAANTLPNYLNRTDSLNDVLHLTHADSPFQSALSTANTITVDFQVGQLTDGDVFVGGFFTNQESVDFYGDGTVNGAQYSFLLNGAALDPNLWSVGVTTVAQPGTDFGLDYGGSVNGRVMQFEVTAVPEPSSFLLGGLLAAGAVWRRRRRTATVVAAISDQA